MQIVAIGRGHVGGDATGEQRVTPSNLFAADEGARHSARPGQL
jgi:hypothetical protein